MQKSEAFQLLEKLATMFGSHSTRTVNFADPTQLDSYHLWVEMPYRLGGGAPTCPDDVCCSLCDSPMTGSGPIPELVELDITSCWSENIKIRSDSFSRNIHDTCDLLPEDEEEDCKILTKLILDGNWRIAEEIRLWWERNHGKNTGLTSVKAHYHEFCKDRAEYMMCDESIHDYI